jgi:hypothetical protein
MSEDKYAAANSFISSFMIALNATFLSAPCMALKSPFAEISAFVNHFKCKYTVASRKLIAWSIAAGSGMSA